MLIETGGAELVMLTGDDVPDTPVPDTPVLSVGQLRKHKEKQHKCKACGKMFKEARQVVVHNERVHHGVTHTYARSRK